MHKSCQGLEKSTILSFRARLNALLKLAVIADLSAEIQLYSKRAGAASRAVQEEDSGDTSEATSTGIRVNTPLSRVDARTIVKEVNKLGLQSAVPRGDGHVECKRKGIRFIGREWRPEKSAGRGSVKVPCLGNRP